MNRIFGLVIFKLINGNLEGRWQNNIVTSFQNENAMRNTGNVSEFIGHYHSTWVDSEGTFDAILNIQRVSNDQFALTWSNLTNQDGLINSSYIGTATEINGELVCAYLLI